MSTLIPKGGGFAIDELESEPSTPRSGRMFFWILTVLVLLLVLGLLLFGMLRLVPGIRQRSELSYQVAQAHDRLDAVEQDLASLPDRYQAQVTEREARMSQAASVFLAESEVARVLDRFNQYSRAAGVEIIDLQNQPTPASEVYNQQIFSLRVSGGVDELLDFLSRLEEVALPGIVVSDLGIAPDKDGLHVLSMQVAMYTSAYAAGNPLDTQAETEGSRTEGARAQRLIPMVSPDKLGELQVTLETDWKANDWAGALEDVTKILSLLPDNPDVIESLYRAHVNYGYFLLTNHDIPEAEAQLKAALTINPSGEEALNQLQQMVGNSALVYADEKQLSDELEAASVAGNWKEVIRLLRLIQIINPLYEGLHQRLYDAYMSYGAQLAAEGKPELAQEQYNQAQASSKADGQAAAPAAEPPSETATPLPTLPATIPPATPPPPTQ